MKKKLHSLKRADSLADDSTHRRRAPKRRGTVFTEDAPDPALVIADAQRTESFHQVHHWNGKPLIPFSVGRESLWLRLRLVDDSPSIAKCKAQPAGFVCDAFKILFLCSHTDAQLAILRANNAAFLMSIDQWAEENITRDQLAEAEKVALAIVNDGEINKVDILPSERKARPAGE